MWLHTGICLAEKFNPRYWGGAKGLQIFSCVQPEAGRNSGNAIPPSVRPYVLRDHSLKPVKIRWISLTLSLISTKTTLSAQFNQFSQFSHPISSVISGNWLAQQILIFCQNHLIKVKVSFVTFTLIMLYVQIWKQYSNTEPILDCAEFYSINFYWSRATSKLQ